MIQIYISIHIQHTHTHTHTVLMDRLSIDEYIVDGIYNGILSIHIDIYFIFLIFTELFLICMLLQCYSVKNNTQMFTFIPFYRNSISITYDFIKIL